MGYFITPLGMREEGGEGLSAGQRLGTLPTIPGGYFSTESGKGARAGSRFVPEDLAHCRSHIRASSVITTSQEMDFADQGGATGQLAADTALPGSHR